MDAEQWTPSQRGRELTVYMYTHDQPFGEGPLAHLPDHKLTSDMQHSSEAWWRFIRTVEEKLAAAGLSHRGCADGDLPLTNYVSLRNEAFCMGPKQRYDSTSGRMVDDKDWIYPPNDRGWNAGTHTVPIRLPCCTSCLSQTSRRVLLVFLGFLAASAALFMTVWVVGD